MAIPIFSRFKQAWNNAFRNISVFSEPPPDYSYNNLGSSSSTTPHRPRVRFVNDRTIVTSIYTRISIDVSAILLRHIKVDENNRYASDIQSMFQRCLTLQPNIDQGPRSFRQDICMTLFDKGVAGIVPVDSIPDEENPDVFQILSLRVGDITQWYPKHIRINLYNEATGLREEIVLEKKLVDV